MANKNFNINQYFQFKLRTVQGKISLFLIGMSVLTAVAFLFSYQQVAHQEERQAYMRSVLMPSINKLEILHHAIKQNQQIEASDTLLLTLNTLASQWKIERPVIFYSQFIDYLDDDTVSSEAKLVSLGRTLKELNTHLAKSEQEAAGFKSNYTTYLIICFICLVAYGFALASLVMNSLFKTVRSIKRDLTSIGLGRLPKKIRTTNNEFKSITTSMQVLVNNLNELTTFAHQVGQGDFNSNIDAFDKEGRLGQSLSEMRDSLKRVSDEDKNRRWFNESIAHFSEKLRSHSGNVAELCDLVMLDIAKQLDAVQGAIYIAETEGSQNWLRMRACYAHDRQKFLDQKLPAGNGLLGQVYLEQAPKYLKEIPENYESIATALGSGMPKCIFLVPLLNNEKVEGILEIATLHHLADHQKEFILKLAESLGGAIAGVRISEETHKLLEESQMAAEQMRAQEEEMRQNAEELEATQEEIHRQMEEAQRQQELYISLLNSVDGIMHRKQLNSNLTLEFISESGRKYLGISEAATSDKINLIKFIHPEDQARVAAEMEEQLASNGCYTVEYRIQKPNGQVVRAVDSGKLSEQTTGNTQIIDGLISPLERVEA
jgi:methyl-accepting chemotaxis protein